MAIIFAISLLGFINAVSTAIEQAKKRIEY